MSQELNICSACTFRHGYNNMRTLEQCCYETCEQFDVNCRETCKKCIEQSKLKCNGGSECIAGNDGAEYLNIHPTHFKSCSSERTNEKDILKCCLNKCKDDYTCQEKCIDSYNALIPIIDHYEEEFSLYKRTSKNVIFIIIAVLLHALIILKIIPMPENKIYAIMCIVLFYILLYYFIK